MGENVVFGGEARPQAEPGLDQKGVHISYFVLLKNCIRF